MSEHLAKVTDFFHKSMGRPDIQLEDMSNELGEKHHISIPGAGAFALEVVPTPKGLRYKSTVATYYHGDWQATDKMWKPISHVLYPQISQALEEIRLQAELQRHWHANRQVPTLMVLNLWHQSTLRVMKRIHGRYYDHYRDHLLAAAERALQQDEEVLLHTFFEEYPEAEIE